MAHQPTWTRAQFSEQQNYAYALARLIQTNYLQCIGDLLVGVNLVVEKHREMGTFGSWRE